MAWNKGKKDIDGSKRTLMGASGSSVLGSRRVLQVDVPNLLLRVGDLPYY